MPAQELQALATFLTETDRGFHVVWGPPGVGKSTLLARMTQLLRWAPELRDQATPGLEWPGLRITVVEYFIRRGATDTATLLLARAELLCWSTEGPILMHSAATEG